MLSWNTRQLTLDALASLRENPSSRPLQVVVVDNASEDGSADAIASAFPEVTLVRNPVNAGYGPGNNIAFRHATGDAVLLLGSDTLVRPGTLDGLLDLLDAHPEAGAVTCRVEGPTGYPERTVVDFPRLRDGAALYLSLPQYARHVARPWDPEREQGADQVSGTCLLLRRALIERIGLFDEAYKIMYTDVELCHRIHAADQAIVYAPEPRLVHFGNQSCVQATGALRAQMYEDIFRYYLATFGLRAAPVMLPILLLRLAALTRGRHLHRLLRIGHLRRGTGRDFGGTLLATT
jgi:GT2 family glycosyltransferase